MLAFILIIFTLLFVTALVVIRWQWRNLKIKKREDLYVLITGCDSGFGNLLTKHLDNLGINVFAGCLTQKGGDDLRKATSNRVCIIDLDVTNQDSLHKAYEEVKSRLPDGRGLWGLVNNAGIFGQSCYVASDWLNIDDYKSVMAVNLYGTIEVTRTFLTLIRREKGRIVNTTSVSGRVAIGGAPYVCSKYAAEGFADSLRSELWKSGVSVHIIEPSGYKTNFCSGEGIRENLRKRYQALDEEKREYYGEDFVSKLTSGMDFERNMSSNLKEVIEAYTHALTARFPSARYLVGWDAKTLYRFLWSAPEWLSSFLLSRPWPTPRGVRVQHKNI
ncbi:17-beta-hydroxysteroid dehydrogenase type 6-like [Mizuhopecten yessoensis]|uniref:17-beta-hydroxysteroid dehydrogenase type 6 n=1 Tax=Mizuhopecten yessoensis TaxID=6573 RepID=A0A210PPV9_MIZYE|nr:17-beta-hydroxysteroid dehydrogenase type 6-like [Mizuhopecten yessoensis]OWF38518.1 17-beta-hydroxysteroid dehydrogenase type 6 [Mizuhopecten yessoensis]